jgi:hypothetical protein
VNDKDFDFLTTPDGILAKPLAMFKRQGDGFLLCYDSFFFLVNYKGAYDRSCYEKVEWISSPQSVAFYHPYIIAFDPQMIEIRHVQTVSKGRVIQLYKAMKRGSKHTLLTLHIGKTGPSTCWERCTVLVHISFTTRCHDTSL